MEYGYTPIIQRKPIRWPGGKRVALILSLIHISQGIVR